MPNSGSREADFCPRRRKFGPGGGILLPGAKYSILRNINPRSCPRYDARARASTVYPIRELRHRPLSSVRQGLSGALARRRCATSRFETPRRCATSRFERCVHAPPRASKSRAYNIARTYITFSNVPANQHPHHRILGFLNLEGDFSSKFVKRISG